MGRWIAGTAGLRGVEVVVTGDFRPRLNLRHDDLREILRGFGAIAQKDVRWSTDVVLRAESAAWLYGDFGEREAELAENMHRGRPDVGVIDVDDFIRLRDGQTVWARDPLSPSASPPVGQPYLQAISPSASNADVVFERDPAEMERALAGHASAQNALAAFLANRQLIPWSPGASAVKYDIAWETAETIWVAEVKSLTNQNEAIQLRLGLGQVLEYAWLLRRHHGRPVRAVLLPEMEPSDPAWLEIAANVEVIVTWPDEFVSLAAALPPSEC